MSADSEHKAQRSIGWIGVGRMGYAMAERLLKAGADVTVYNRTRAKAEPLAALGAKIVASPRDLIDRDIVFTMVSGPDAFLEVTIGESGLYSCDGKKPALLVDCSTISTEASATVREVITRKGGMMLDAPVSGNAKVVEAGKLAIVASGDREAFEAASRYLEIIAEGVTYVGEGELARMVKICHNVFLGVVAQSLSEIVVLAEKGGVSRGALLDFINKSVMGSMFTQYKTSAFVNLDYTPTFTPPLLCKDLDLGLSAGRELGVPLPLASQVRDIVQSLIGNGYTDCDFAALLELQAKAANLSLKSENKKIDTGL